MKGLLNILLRQYLLTYMVIRTKSKQNNTSILMEEITHIMEFYTFLEKSYFLVFHCFHTPENGISLKFHFLLLLVYRNVIDSSRVIFSLSNLPNSSNISVDFFSISTYISLWITVFFLSSQSSCLLLNFLEFLHRAGPPTQC